MGYWDPPSRASSYIRRLAGAKLKPLLMWLHTLSKGFGCSPGITEILISKYTSHKNRPKQFVNVSLKTTVIKMLITLGIFLLNFAYKCIQMYVNIIVKLHLIWGLSEACLKNK